MPRIPRNGRWTRAAGPRVPAFSLAELMIALGVLAMGLLVIGAALPVGVRYTRHTLNAATGESAAQYALDLIESSVALNDNVVVEVSAGHYLLTKFPGLFYPRGDGQEYDAYGTALDPHKTIGRLRPDHEPVIKVHALLTENIYTDVRGGGVVNGQVGTWLLVPTAPERVIENWFQDRRFMFNQFRTPVGFTSTEYEYDTLTHAMTIDNYRVGHWLKPALPSTAVVYPPIAPDSPFDPNMFLGDMANFSQYMPRPVRIPQTPPVPNDKAETVRVAERRTVWVAFYRRVSYQPGSDPYLYEFIVVALRVPGDKYRFSQQVPGDLVGPPAADAYSFVAPVPWLKYFVRLPDLPPTQPFPNYQPVQPPGNQLPYPYVLQPGFKPSPTLRFVADAELGTMLPKGNIFIPAVNDYLPTQLQPFSNNTAIQLAGLIPSAPDTLPVYEVLDRSLRPDGNYDIIVRNDGFYPRVIVPGFPFNPAGGANGDARFWPVWVIPPAFDTRTSPPTGVPQPFYPDQANILAVERRFVRLRVIP